MISLPANKNHIAGALTAATGAIAAYQGYRYQIGNFTEMGPGFFPFALGCILVLLGVLTAANRDTEEDDDATSHMPPLDYRGAICIMGSILIFLVVVRCGGLVPAAFCATIIAALGDRGAKTFGTGCASHPLARHHRARRTMTDFAVWRSAINSPQFEKEAS
jgi:hypothetical protein